MTDNPARADPADPLDTSALEPAAAEAVIRRAIEIDEHDSQLISLGDIKATLAALGVPPETVDVAAADVRKDLTDDAPRTVGQLLTHLLSFSLFSLPGLYMTHWALGQTPGRRFVFLGIGGLWTVFCILCVIDAFWEFNRLRRKHS